MAMKNLPGWQSQAAPGGDGSAYFRTGADLFNKAIQTAQGGLTKHEERLKENAQSAELQSTAKLAEIAKANGGKLTQADKDSVGFYSGMKLDELLTKQDESRFKNNMDIQGLAMDKTKLAEQIAHWKRSDSNQAAGYAAANARAGAKGKKGAGYGKPFSPGEFNSYMKMFESIGLDDTDAQLYSTMASDLRKAKDDPMKIVDYVQRKGSGGGIPGTDVDMPNTSSFLGFGTDPEKARAEYFRDQKSFIQ